MSTSTLRRVTRLVTRRKVVAAAVIGILVGAVVGQYPRYSRYHHGCGRDGKDDTLVMISGEDLNPGRERQALVKAWNDVHPGGPTVRLVEIPGGADAEYSQILASQQLGSCAYDVLSLDVVWIPGFIRAGLLEPLSKGDFNPEKFLKKPWQTGTGQDGRQYAIPFHSDVGLLYYRKDIVKNPPRTWAELRKMTTPEAVQRLQTKDAAGLVNQLADYEGLTVNGMEAVWRAGGTIEQRDGKITVDDDAARGIQDLVDDLKKHNIILNESAAYRETASAQAFAEGRALFLRNWPYVYFVLAAEMNDRFGVAQLPGATGTTAGRGALGGQDLAISKNSLHKAEAREFIKFLTELPQQQRLFACGGYVPVLWKIYENISACSELPGRQSTSKEADPVNQKELQNFADILQKALNNAELRPDVTYYPGFSRAFHRYLHDAISSKGPGVDRSELADRLTACAVWTSPRADCP